MHAAGEGSRQKGWVVNFLKLEQPNAGSNSSACGLLEIEPQMLNADHEVMKPLFVQFRPRPAGLSVSREEAPSAQPPQQDTLRDMRESADRVSYPKRLRVTLMLALLSWAIFALLAWAIFRF